MASPASPPAVHEELLGTFAECFLYRLQPSMASAGRGHLAQSWGLDEPWATARLTVRSREDALALQFHALETPKQRGDGDDGAAGTRAGEAAVGKQLLVCVIRPPEGTWDEDANPRFQLEHWVEPCVDSSRYFALRVERPRADGPARAQTVLIGMGFRDRGDAAMFKTTLGDHWSFVRRHRRGLTFDDTPDVSSTAPSSAEGAHGTLSPASSGLQGLEGSPPQRIHLGGIATPSRHKPEHRAGHGSSGSTSGAVPRLPPPPVFKAATQADASASAGDDEAEEWGDFEG